MLAYPIKPCEPVCNCKPIRGILLRYLYFLKQATEFGKVFLQSVQQCIGNIWFMLKVTLFTFKVLHLKKQKYPINDSILHNGNKLFLQPSDHEETVS